MAVRAPLMWPDGLERLETVNHFFVAANVRSIRSTLRSSAQSSPSNPPRDLYGGTFSKPGGVPTVGGMPSQWQARSPYRIRRRFTCADIATHPAVSNRSTRHSSRR
jgi:hypothetical protein